MKANEKVKDVINMYAESILEDEQCGRTDIEIRLKFISYLALNYTNTNEVIDVLNVYKHFCKKVLKTSI